jgi:hypothetical protein
MAQWLNGSMAQWLNGSMAQHPDNNGARYHQRATDTAQVLR